LELIQNHAGNPKASEDYPSGSAAIKDQDHNLQTAPHLIVIRNCFLLVRQEERPIGLRRDLSPNPTGRPVFNDIQIMSNP
jgi:hypothetical protein